VSAPGLLLCAFAILSATPAAAHRADEYLQATTILVEKARIEAEIRLVPGVKAFGAVFANIDRDRDRTASEAERHAYAQRVLGDLSLSLDGRRLTLRLISSVYAEKEWLRRGTGEIQILFEADVPVRRGERRLTFENHHQRRTSTYLVNGIVPRDTNIRLVAQHRSPDQASYELNYTLTSAPALTPATPP
jgi:hypothetical protein